MVKNDWHLPLLQARPSHTKYIRPRESGDKGRKAAEEEDKHRRQNEKGVHVHRSQCTYQICRSHCSGTVHRRWPWAGRCRHRASWPRTTSQEGRHRAAEETWPCKKNLQPVQQSEVRAIDRRHADERQNRDKDTASKSSEVSTYRDPRRTCRCLPCTRGPVCTVRCCCTNHRGCACPSTG